MELKRMNSSDYDNDKDFLNGVSWLLSLRHYTSPPSSPSPSVDASPQPISETSQQQREEESAMNSRLSEEEFKKRKRATRDEIVVLREVFNENPLPSHEVRASLAKKLGWSPQKVKIWFQNERAKIRKHERSSEVEVRRPHQYAVPPTSSSVVAPPSSLTFPPFGINKANPSQMGLSISSTVPPKPVPSVPFQQPIPSSMSGSFSSSLNTYHPYAVASALPPSVPVRPASAHFSPYSAYYR